MTKQGNQGTTPEAAAFTRPRRLAAAVALSVGAGSLVYGTILALPAAAASGTSAGTSCSTGTATASASPSNSDTGSASPSASSTDSATASPSASATGSASPSASDSSTATASGSADASPTECATDSASASSSASASASTSASASESRTATASASASATASTHASATASASPTPTPTQTPVKGGPTAVPSPPSTPVPVFTLDPTGSYYTYTDVPPGDASYQLPHGTISRAQMITRAQLWVAQQVPYSETAWHTNQNGTYRQDCSGYVSMAWDLDQNTDFWTGNLNLVSHTIPAAQLLPGDILLSSKHTILFAGWANAQHTEFDYYEEAHPGTVARYVVDAPLSAFLDNGFAPFRYDGVTDSGVIPANPSAGDLYATLSQLASEIDPPGVTGAEPEGLDPTAGPTRLSALVAADDVLSTEGARSEGAALAVGGVFLVSVGLLIRRPIPLRGRRRR